MKHVFISYSRKDAEFVKLLVEELRHSEHEVWFDTTDIRGGTDWEKEIEKGIDNSYAFIIVHSANSKKSEWVDKEIELVKGQEHKIPIMPLKIDKAAVVSKLARNQSIDFSGMFDGNDVDTIRGYRSSVIKMLKALELERPMLRLLKNLKHTNGDIREAACRKIGELGDQDAAVPLIEKLGDLDSDVRYEAAIALGKLKINVSYKSLVRTMMNDDNPDVVAAAANALGELGLTRAIGPLSSKLTDPDRFVRACAVRALGKLNNVSAVGVLVDLLRKDGISDVREAAKEALQSIGGQEAARAVRRMEQSNMLGRETENDEKIDVEEKLIVKGESAATKKSRKLKK